MNEQMVGISAQMTGYAVLGLIIPAIIILSLIGKLDATVLGTLLGTFIGYVLSGIGEDKKDAS
ncbi:MAG: hypothetical protein ACE5EN_02060 [Nitrospinota bacterium]